MEGEPKFHYNEELLNEYKDKLGALLNVSDENQIYRIMEETVSKVDILRKKYGTQEMVKYSLYHVLSFSTIHPEMEIIADDFPGEDSVAEFVDGLAKTYNIE